MMAGWTTSTMLVLACAAQVWAAGCPCSFDDSSTETWDCSSLDLTRVPTLCWPKHKEAYRIFLYQNKLVNIGDDAFNGLTNLAYLQMYSNRISDMGEKSLENLEELKYLDLSYNELQTMPPTIFDNLSRLSYLTMYNNSLKGIPSLQGLISLDTLYIHNNRLTSLPIMPISSQPIDLSFYGNYITKIPAVAVLPLRDHSVLRMDSGTVICCENESERIKVLQKFWTLRDATGDPLELNHMTLVC